MRKYRKWRRQDFLRSEMKISKNKYENCFYIYARGKGEDASIVLKYRDYDCDLHENLNIEKAKEFISYINMAIEDCEKRKLMKEDECD